MGAGRLDGFWEIGLQPWDIAAGALIIREAGGMLSELQDRGDFLTTGNVVAGTPRVHAALKELLAGVL